MSDIPVIIPYFTHEDAEEVIKILDSGWVAQGAKVAEFENSEQLPKSDLVNQQVTSDIFAENNESFILKDFVEQIIEKLQIATRKNYGLVKIGENINDDNGKISVEGYSFASKEKFGLVKIGDGISDDDETIDVQPIGVATTSEFGVVKFGEDFLLNANNEIEVKKAGDEEMVIYDLAKIEIVSNGIRAVA